MGVDIASNQRKLEREAQLFTRHLTRSDATPAITARYIDIITNLPQQAVTTTDQKLLSLATNHPIVLPFLDSYAAFFRPRSELRRRLYVAFAVLESSPDFAQYFLPQKYGPLYIVLAAYTGLAAIVKLVVGSVLAKVLI